MTTRQTDLLLDPPLDPLLFLLGLTVPSVSGLSKTCRGGEDKCGKFLSVVDQHSIKRITTYKDGTTTCEDKCVVFPTVRIGLTSFFRKYRGWECGSCPTKVVDDGDAENTSLVSLEGPTSDFSIVSCDVADMLTVQGNLTDRLQVGNRILYVDGTVDPCSSGCNMIYRKITSIQDGSTPGGKVLTTKLLSIAEVFGSPDLADPTYTDLDSTFPDMPVESLVDCSRRRRLIGKEKGQHVRDLQQGVCKASWLKKNPDGRCSETNCFVGTNGDPDNCFACKTTCDNGCGALGITFSGYFGYYRWYWEKYTEFSEFDSDFDFGPACCNHDHCWSSTTPREDCDTEFFYDMSAACPDSIFPTFYEETFALNGVSHCSIIANFFFWLVSNEYVGDYFYNSAQATQKAYEATSACIAQCPSTQKSGGQGTTTLTIDLLRDSGKFEVEYHMYDIKDELTILYENNVIFTTGGLVNGTQTTTVSYVGSSTTIRVIVNAPTANTRWDVSVGCPTDL
jgi:hypothetical protein